MVTTWPRNFPGLGTGAERIAQRITQTSGERLTVKVFAAGELVAPFDSFDAVANGDAHMYHAADYYWQKKHRGLNFFTTVPLGLTTKEMNAWIAYGGGQELWDELSGGFGIKPLLAGNSGVQMGGWFQSTIKSLDDLKTLKMRIPGLGGAALKELGAETISLPGGEIFNAIKEGRINAAEWVSPYNDLAFGIQDLLKIYMYPGFHEPGTAVSLGINLSFWQGLTDEDRTLITACTEAENDVMIAEFNANNGNSLRKLKEAHGVSVEAFPKEVWDAFAKTGEEVVANVARDDLLSAKIYASYIRFRKSVAGWSEISDQAYLRARADVLAGA
ncbi:MAG: TRAP transporter substrate-binding protein [Pseudomonadota bacterium]